MSNTKTKKLCIILCMFVLAISTVTSFAYFNHVKNRSGTETAHHDESSVEDSMNRNKEYGYTTTNSRLKISQLELTVKKYGNFISTLEKGLTFNIPGLENTYIGRDCPNMVPQGICIAEDYFITTAYDASGENGSVLYLTNATAKLLEFVIELPLKIHAGGIAYDGESLWICADEEYDETSNTGVIYKIDFDIIKQLKNQSDVYAALEMSDMEKYHISNSASFCTYFNNRLWVGTFTKHSKKESTFGSLMSYDTKDIDESPNTKTLNHESFLVLPNRSQGACFFENQGSTYMAITRSHTRSKHLGKSAYISEIRVYKPEFDAENPTKILKKGTAIVTLDTPPMIEEICFNELDGMLYAIFESGASKYSTDNTSSFLQCKYIFDKIAAINPISIFSLVE